MAGVSFFDNGECPCGSAERFSACCGPLHRGERAVTAEALMRSRYSAYAVGDERYLLASWHPMDRPDTVEFGGARWIGLDIVEVVDGGEEDAEGIVEFVARYVDGHGDHAMRERSRFVRHGGRWVYAGEST